jgi:hypothetical protein
VLYASCVSEENIVLLKDKNIKGLCLDDCVDYIKGEAGFDRDDGNDRRHGREFFFAHRVWSLRFRRWESSWKLFLTCVASTTELPRMIVIAPDRWIHKVHFLLCQCPFEEPGDATIAGLNLLKIGRPLCHQRI